MVIRAPLLLLVGLAACGPSADSYDLVLRGGWIVDGTGNPRYRGDVALRGDRIAAVGTVDTSRARRTLDVRGMVVAPGFIDMLGWSHIKLLADGRAASKVTQGITTEITGEGSSPAPQDAVTIAEDSLENASRGVVVDWEDFDGFFARLERSGSAINVASFVGAAQVRKLVLGREDRAPTPEELERMVALVDRAMRQGAVGLSAALAYAPGFYAETDEVVALAQAARRHGGIYATHLRDEGPGIDAALDETFAVARSAGIPVEIWHLKREGEAHWHDMPRVLARIDSARAAGLDVTADIYPYVASATDLDAVVPQWAHEGGDSALARRLRDPVERRRIREEIESPPGGNQGFYRGAGGAGGVLVAGTLSDSLHYVQGRTIAEVAAVWGKEPVDAMLDLLIRDDLGTSAIFFSMSEADVRAAMRRSWVSFCTDYGAVAPDGILSDDRVHPRVYGSFPRILGRYVRDEAVLTLEDAVRKMTSLPAQRVGLFDRGLLRPGLAADVVVFDADVVLDHATFEAPHQFSVGVRHVFVNGTAVLADGRLTEARPGRGIRGPGWIPAD